MDMRGNLGLSKYYTKPSQPKFYGKCMIKGIEYEIKGWEKDSPNGKWISMFFEEPKSDREKLEARRDEFAPTSKSNRSDGTPF